MCGIAGRINYRTGAPVRAEGMAGMCHLTRHRGPDAQGVWTDGHVGLGHRRLAVIDLSEAAGQPFHSVDRQLTIVFNGEIYNFEAIRRELEKRGCAFATHSDTEVILQAYRVFGTGCLTHFRGMFAFAIWDHQAQRLFAARDRVGKKPLYYREDADGFAFASEPKAFLAETSFRAEPDAAALGDYLSFQYVPAPASAFRGLKRLPPGHYLILENGRLQIERYWRLRFAPKLSMTNEEAEAEVLERLREAVRLRLISDVPLGAFLSGGVDSSLIVALMAEVGSGPVNTFSIGFEEPEYNELPFAKRVAEHLGTRHHELVVRPDAVGILPRLVWHYNEPYADSSAVPTFYVAEMARKHVTVALNGDGGDEAFAGYDRYAASLVASRIDHLPPAVRRTSARAARVLRGGPPRSLRNRLVRFAEAAADSRERRYARWMFHFDQAQKQELCTPEFLAASGARDSTDALAAAFAESEATSFLDTLQDVDIRTYLPDDLLVKVDIATMAFGLESRSPLLDHEVLECAVRLPESYRLQGLQKKRLLRQIARRYVPADVIDRPKAGFGVPIDRWFRNELRDLTHDVLLGSRMRERGYFHQPVIARYVAEHEQGLRNWHYQLWNLLMFELWHRMFIDGEGLERPA